MKDKRLRTSQPNFKGFDESPSGHLNGFYSFVRMTFPEVALSRNALIEIQISTSIHINNKILVYISSTHIYTFKQWSLL